MYIRYNGVMIYSHFKTLSFCYSDALIFTKDTKHSQTLLSLSLFTLQKFSNWTLKTKNYITAPWKITFFFQDIYIFSTKIDTQHDHIINHFLSLFKFLFTPSLLYISLVSAFLGDSYARVGTLLRLSLSRQLNPTTRTVGLFPKLVLTRTVGDDGGGGLVARGVDGGGATTRSSSRKSKSFVKGLETLVGGDPVKNSGGDDVIFGSCS